MLLALITALALTASSVLDVPYVPQSDALCGGAAVAMVYRYWGDRHAGAAQFASLVNRRAGAVAEHGHEEVLLRPTLPPATRCDSLLAGAITSVERLGMDSADAILDDVRGECPESAGPLRELAGVRFGQQRWSDAAALARQA